MKLATRRADPGQLSRINLLPPELVEQERFRRKRPILIGVVAAAGVVVALLYVQAGAAHRSSQRTLDAADATHGLILSQQAVYAYVPVVESQLAARQAQLAAAMQGEILWSDVLNRLSRSLPSSVSLTTLTAIEALPGAAAGTAGAAATATGTAPAGIGTITFAGAAKTQGAVATWLEVLSRQRGFSNAYLSTSTYDTASQSGPRLVKFVTNITLDAQAVSGRFPTTGTAR